MGKIANLQSLRDFGSQMSNRMDMFAVLLHLQMPTTADRRSRAILRLAISTMGRDTKRFKERPLG